MNENINVKRKLIEATSEIIDTEGIKNVSIRKIAAKAGYTSGTIYSHFKNFDHLILLSCLRFLRYYNENLKTVVGSPKDSVEENFLVWNFFCECTFKNPEIFYFIFFNSSGFSQNNLEDYYELKDFYKFFPEDIKDFSSKFYPMLLKLNLKERNKYLILKMVKEKKISPSNVSLLNDNQIFIYKGYLEKAKEAKTELEQNRIKRSCIRSLKILYKAYLY